MAAGNVTLRHTLSGTDPESRDQTLHILLDIPDDLILVMDPDGNLLLANNTFLRRSGLQPQEIPGKNLIDILPPALAQSRLEVIKQVAVSGKPARFEDAGVIGWYDNIVYPVFDPQGRVNKIVVQARDISMRKQVEAELQQSLATINSLLNGPVDIAAVLDLDGQVLMANETLARRLNMSVEEIIGVNLFDLMPAEIAESRREKMRKAIESGETVRFQDQGITGIFDNVLNPIQDSEGCITRIAVMSRDITELRETEKAQQRTEGLLQTVINHAPVVVFALDRQGGILLVEGKSTEQTGSPINSMVGLNVIDTFYMFPSDTAIIQKALDGETLTHTFRLPNGKIFETHFFPQMGPEGNVAEVYGMALDITTQTKALEELQQSRNQLEVILGGISDSVSVRDNDLKLIYANDAAAKLKGFATARDYIEHGRPGDDFEIIDADGKAIALDDYLRQRTASIQNGIPFEIRYRRLGALHDGWIHMKTAPIRDETGAIRMSVFISRDITEQKRTLDELSRSSSELRQRVTERTAELAAANQVLRNEVELRRQAEDELRAAVARAEALAHIAMNLNARHDLGEIVETICEEALRISPYQTSAVFLYDDEQDNLFVAAAQGMAAPHLLQSGPASRTWYEMLMENAGLSLTVRDAQTYASDPEFVRWVDGDTRTVVVMSMIHAGEFIGALVVSSQVGIHHPGEDELVLLRGLANLGATSMAKGLLFQQLDEARSRLQDMSKKLLNIQDGERRNLAMELHDEIGQMLTSLGMQLEQAEHQASGRDPNRLAGLANEIAAARQQVREVLQQVREMSLRLRPAMLDEFGLVPALLSHFERFSTSSGIKVDFRHSGLYERFPLLIENAVFRMIQESLTNIARYAGVEEASVRLLAEEDMLIAQVRDQGIGFDPDLRLSEKASSGLSGMSERITLCGGQLTIESEPGHGTCLTAEFPLEAGKRHRT